MKRGSAVHQTLEEEVHEAIVVDVTTTEDALGLRLWNVVQGLRTLRQTGMTREFEIWGVVDGLLVTGVIDEISFTCPDGGLETEGLLSSGSAEMGVTGIPSCIDSKDGSLGRGQVLPRKVYLTEVKTRRARNLPNSASFRPALFQLMLYHRFFSNLALGNFDADILFRRHQVDMSANLSDSFINQVVALDGYNNRVAEKGRRGTEPLDLLLGNNSVQSLWGLVMREFQLTVPAGTLGVGNVLKVEYRSQIDGSVFGQKTFLHQDKLLDQYLADKMKWWRGEREGRGVVIEEAYKCQSCEFADACTWRVAKIEELTQNCLV
jgi:exonuclease V